MCSFGGPGMEWLFVTSIPPAQSAPGFDASLDGAVLVLRPGVKGLAEVPFGGWTPSPHTASAPVGAA